jgi:hypothetical protein
LFLIATYCEKESNKNLYPHTLGKLALNSL